MNNPTNNDKTENSQTMRQIILIQIKNAEVISKSMIVKL